MIITRELAAFVSGAFGQVPPEGVAVTIETISQGPGDGRYAVKIRVAKVIDHRIAEYSRLTTWMEIQQYAGDPADLGRQHMAESLRKLDERKPDAPRASPPEPGR